MNEFEREQNLQKIFHKLSEKNILDISNQLPDKKYYEFLYHAWFTKNTTEVKKFYEKWNEWKEWHYPIDDLVRFKKIVLDNKQHIKDKKILDIGSHLGYISLFCLYNGCQKVIGVEPRKIKHELSNFICAEAGYQNFEFVLGSTHDNFIFTDYAIDTVILSALIYHIADHYTLLEKISKSSAKCLIIENCEKKDIAFQINPQVKWEIEKTSEGKDNGGWFGNKTQSLVGTPNQPFINQIMFELGWTLQTNQYFQVQTHLPEKRLMSTSVFVR